MAVRMKALRRIYVSSERKEYAAGQTFSVPDDSEADRLVRRSKAERVGAKNVTDLPAPTALPAGEDLAALREEYRGVVGKGPFHGWDAAQLREKIATYRTTNMGDSTLTTHLTAEE